MSAFPIIPLADDLYFVCHDERGRSRVQAGTQGIGLAGALLAESVLADRLDVSNGQVVLRPGSPPPSSLPHLLLEIIEVETRHRSLAEWVSFFARTSTAQVCERMLRQHRLAEDARGRHAPTDINLAAWSSAKLSAVLNRGYEMSWQDLALACLCQSMGLSGRALGDLSEDGALYLKRLYRDLRLGMPSIVEIATHCEVAISEAVLAPGT